MIEGHVGVTQTLHGRITLEGQKDAPVALDLIRPSG